MNYLEAPVERVEYRGDTLYKLNQMIAQRSILTDDLKVAERPGTSGESSALSLVEAAYSVLIAARRTLREDNHLDIQQIAALLVRDTFAPLARESDEPIAWLTGNSYMPPLRDLAPAEVVYQADNIDPNGSLWEDFMEQIEIQCHNFGIYLGCPDYDNALYVVDLRRWEYIAEDFEGGDSLNDEWRSL